jgi:PadR family transcriptional regulator PadR
MALDSAAKEHVDRWEEQLRRGSLELAILASLWHRPLYGLEILRNLESGSGLVVTEGTIYPLLSRLRTDGVVTSKWIESQLGHPRRYYELTRIGRTRLCLMEQRWTAYSKALTRILKLIPEIKEREKRK